MTPEELNRINAEFWVKQQEKFAESMADVTVRQLTFGAAAEEQLNRPVSEQRPLEQIAAEALPSMQKASNRAAASNPRPKKKPTLKSEFQAAMAKVKREGLTLGEFIESAKAGSIDGIELGDHESGRYVIDAAAVDGDPEKKAHETLKSWWKGELAG